MAQRRGLVVLSGGRAPRTGNYLVVGDGMIISILGMLQLAEPRGVSLNKLHQTLDRVREGRLRVDWYALRDSLLRLENDGQLHSVEVRGRSRLSGGLSSYRRWGLADWEVWWAALVKTV